MRVRLDKERDPGSAKMVRRTDGRSVQEGQEVEESEPRDEMQIDLAFDFFDLFLGQSAAKVIQMVFTARVDETVGGGVLGGIWV